MFIILDTNFCCSYYYYIAIAPTKKKNYYFNLYYDLKILIWLIVTVAIAIRSRKGLVVWMDGGKRTWEKESGAFGNPRKQNKP